MMNYYKIAGLTVAMEVGGRTEKQAEPYRCAPCENPDIVIPPDGRDFTRTHLDVETIRYMYTATLFYMGLIDYQGLMLHSSAVVVDGRAYLFSAVSGTGKSTHTQRWLEMFGDRAYVLNDDKPALRLIDGVWHACGTPWSGKHDVSRPECVPLQGIAMLSRGETNHIEPYRGAGVVFEMLTQTIRPKDKRDELLELLDQLVTQVPVWKLHCNMDPEAALVAYNAMSGT